MTNSRLIISPIPRTEAETALQAFDAADDPPTVSVEELDGAPESWRVVVYLDARHSSDAALDALRRSGIASGEPTVEPIPETDWVRRSLKGLAPVRAGRFVVHGSHDRVRTAGCAHAVEIDAGLAFGTGHHATTQGCLIGLDRLLKRRRPGRVIDVGSGSGVLAIAAAMASQAAVVATDIDGEAVQVARANARANATGAQLKVYRADGLAHPSVTAVAPYDVVLANILAQPLMRLARPIGLLTRAGGTAILSGLTLDQATAVEASYRAHGFIRRERIDIGDWSTLVLERSGQRPKRTRPRGRCRRALR